MRHFVAELVHLDGGVTVALRGELDLVGAAELERTVRGLASRYEAHQVELDCAALDFCDSSGVLALVRAARTVSGPGRIALRNLQPRVRRVLDLTGAIDAFDAS